MLLRAAPSCRGFPYLIYYLFHLSPLTLLSTLSLPVALPLFTLPCSPLVPLFIFPLRIMLFPHLSGKQLTPVGPPRGGPGSRGPRKGGPDLKGPVRGPPSPSTQVV